MKTKSLNTNPTDLFRQYIEECRYVRNLRPESLRSSDGAFRFFTTIVPEVVYVTDVTPEVITLFFKRIQTRERTKGKQKVIGIKDSTLTSYGGRLKAFCKWLVTHGHLASNPFDKVTMPRPTYTDHRALRGDEIKRIMGAVAQYAHTPFLLRRDMAIIGVLTFCGLRRNELIGLEVRDIDLLGGLITVRGETSKSKATRKVPINVHLRLYLSEYLHARQNKNCKCPFLFVSNSSDTRLTAHGLKHWVIRLCKLSGVKFHVHRFRHTFATNLAMQDVGIAKIKSLMGHTDIKMTNSYLRSISTEDMRGDVNKLSFETLE